TNIPASTSNIVAIAQGPLANHVMVLQQPVTILSAANITSGILPDARLSSNVALLNTNQTFTGVNMFNNGGNNFTGNGAGLTGLNGSNVTTGAVADSRLTPNVALRNADQTFTGANTFTAQSAFAGVAVFTNSNVGIG